MGKLMVLLLIGCASMTLAADQKWHKRCFDGPKRIVCVAYKKADDSIPFSIGDAQTRCRRLGMTLLNKLGAARNVIKAFEGKKNTAQKHITKFITGITAKECTNCVLKTTNGREQPVARLRNNVGIMCDKLKK
ncbi:uncharacterized protein [Argopecten irradians]|uniref:uncharacterized protein n=1 Tax=Argopecten irradians TaxID=31199 RepID=UPI0037245939